MLIIVFSIQSPINADLRFDDRVFEQVLDKYGKSAKARVESWRELFNELRASTKEDKLFEVNKFFNQLSFKEDITLWGKNDYWATPIEFLSTAAGDCEDYTIAKYFTLVELGISDEKLRLMYVTATRPRQAHMVLAYYETPNSIPLVLDNLNKRILPASQRRDLIPIYSFNGEGLWLAKAQGRGRQMQNGNNNKLWIDVNNRIKEGF